MDTFEPVTFVVPGKPVTWKRASQGQRGRGHKYTPVEVENHMTRVSDEWRKLGMEPFDRKALLGLAVAVYFKRPDNHYRTNGEIKPWALRLMPTGPGDLDNYTKLVKDALNNVAYHDDRQIVQYWEPFGRLYAGAHEMLRTEITLGVAKPPDVPMSAIMGPQLALVA